MKRNLENKKWRYDFSLILATVGRVNEVDKFIQSVVNCKYNINKVQLIIVDQNKHDLIKEIINKYNNILKIDYIKSDKEGLSYNRNIGIKYAEGRIIAFPDDDCEYLEDTLESVYNAILNLDNDIVLGRIIDRDLNDVIRKWPKKEKRINKMNFFVLHSSITTFIDSNSFIDMPYFDEELGVGARYGSCEDTDYIYRLLNKKLGVIYTPEVILYHPKKEEENLNKNRIKKYGEGFGAFCKKNISFSTVYIFISVILVHIFKFLKAEVKRNKDHIEIEKIALKSRINIFIKYEGGDEGE